MSNFERYLQKRIRDDRDLRESYYESMRLSFERAEQEKRARVALEEQARARALRLQALVAPIMLGDIAVAYRKLQDFGAKPNQEVQVGVRVKVEKCITDRRLFQRTHEVYVPVHDRFWVLGGYELSRRKQIKRTEGIKGEPYSGGEYTAEYVTGNCILLDKAGRVMSVTAESKVSNIPTWEPLMATGEPPVEASIEDLAPSQIFGDVTEEQIASPETCLTVVNMRETLTRLVLKAAAA